MGSTKQGDKAGRTQYMVCNQGFWIGEDFFFVSYVKTEKMCQMWSKQAS